MRKASVIFSFALAVIPAKDGFWSTKVQTGHPYHDSGPAGLELRTSWSPRTAPDQEVDRWYLSGRFFSGVSDAVKAFFNGFYFEREETMPLVTLNYDEETHRAQDRAQAPRTACARNAHRICNTDPESFFDPNRIILKLILILILILIRILILMRSLLFLPFLVTFSLSE